ncbi:hypothetical protein [Lacibacter sp.]|uniref:hypothetical protein n=1 Tax=Lacibacter sp. TaxID=1915409 RepID=UPI002B4B104E|nr:hypothetical protein [Lacibacter sp.]HLP36714.1 hypothetical protein [Lacibacter sp.]
MTYLLFAVYLVLFSWLITRVKFIQQSGLPNYWLIALFVLKVAAGVAYGWFYTTIPNYEQSADSWKFFFDAKNDTQLLYNDPLRYFTSIYDNPYDRDYRHLFSSVNSYWNDLKHTYMVKIVSLFNVFSGSRYYVNVIFYSFITFFGPIAFIRVMNDVFPDRKLLITCGTFLFPSFLFWSSGIHKDGLIFTYVSLLVFVVYFGMKKKELGIKEFLLVGLLLMLIFPVRNHVVLACIPGLFAWWLAEKYFKRKWIAFVGVTILGTTAFFSAKYIHPKLDLPISIVLRNKDFIKLGGNSFLPQRKLEPTFTGFVQNAPQALNHTLVRPYVTEFLSPLYLASALEILCIWILVSVWFFRFTDNPYRHSVVQFLFLVSMVLLLLTGYIVPQLGAIVRYRAIFFPFILVPIIATIAWKKNKLE